MKTSALRTLTCLIFLLAWSFATVDLCLGADGDAQTTLVYPSFLHTYGIRKATKTHLMLYTRNRIKVNDPQGLAITRLESWDDPNDHKDDDEVTGYGINSGAGMVIYNTSMKSLGFYGVKESKERALNHPLGVAANAGGDVYVADTGSHRIMRFFNAKKEMKFVTAIGGKGALPGKFDSPTDVALDDDNFAYITDTNNHRVQILRSDNQLEMWFGKQGTKEGELWHPTGIAVTNGKERWSYYKDKFIVLIDLDGTRIQKLTLDGEFINATTLKDFGYARGRLMYLDIDYYSNIWVTDFVNGCVHKFDRDLNPLTSFGKQGTGDREFFEPRGIAIYKRFGQVFIAEKESAQYYWVGTDIKDYSAKYREDDGLIELDFFLTEPSFVTVTVENDEAGVEMTIFERVQFFTGKQEALIDRNLTRVHRLVFRKTRRSSETSEDNPAVFAKGKYKFKIKIEPTYSSYKYFAKEVAISLVIK